MRVVTLLGQNLLQRLLLQLGTLKDHKVIPALLDRLAHKDNQVIQVLTVKLVQQDRPDLQEPLDQPEHQEHLLLGLRFRLCLEITLFGYLQERFNVLTDSFKSQVLNIYWYFVDVLRAIVFSTFLLFVFNRKIKYESEVLC